MVTATLTIALRSFTGVHLNEELACVKSHLFLAGKLQNDLHDVQDTG
jgi:hypothetical protein